MAEHADSSNPSSMRMPRGLALSVIQNLEDAGCDKETVEEFIELGETNGQLKLLENHRRGLLDDFHKKQKQIECLDYLVYQIRKEKQNKI